MLWKLSYALVINRIKIIHNKVGLIFLSPRVLDKTLLQINALIYILYICVQHQLLLHLENSPTQKSPRGISACSSRQQHYEETGLQSSKSLKKDMFQQKQFFLRRSIPLHTCTLFLSIAYIVGTANYFFVHKYLIFCKLPKTVIISIILIGLRGKLL